MRSSIIAVVLAAACALAWTPAAPAAEPLQASFVAEPDHPAPGEIVTLSSTTTPQATTGRRYAWDLDNDGSFDDGTTESVTTTFASAGDYVVRLEASQSGTAVQT